MSKMSVHLSVKRVNCEKNERNICQNLYTVYKDRLSSFLTRRMVFNGWWTQPLLSEILGQIDPVASETLIFDPYLLVPFQP